jgi:hypothetical protein
MIAAGWNMKIERDNILNDVNITDNGGRRKINDRRNFHYTIYIPERRCGSDRRAGNDRRKQSRLLDRF